MATTLTGLLLPLTSSIDAVWGDLSFIASWIGPLNDQINPQGSNSVSQLVQNNGSALDFSGLGAQAFRESLTVHLDVTGKVTDAFNGASKALSTFEDALNSLNSQYDGRLNTIKGTNYAPGSYPPGDSLSAEAQAVFYSLHADTAMIDNVISEADGNSALTGGSSNLIGQLGAAYMNLYGQVEGANISVTPTPGTPKLTPAQRSAQQAQVRQMVLDALDSMYSDISQAYTGWGNGVQQAFSTFQSGLNAVEQQVQPYADLLTNPTSAASIFDLISMISQSNEPIAIVQTGPNSIMVVISGTNAGAWNYDTNLWNALGTGMGQDMPYEQDVIDAIHAYCAEHGLTDPQVTLAGHSLGGMVAQQIADKGLFDVTQVVTFGSPTMGDPMPGITYDLYAAKWDPIPMLSRYENLTLPASLQQVASKFPAFQTNYESFWHNPFSWSGLKHDVGAVGRDVGATWDNAKAARGLITGIPYLLAEAGGSYALMGSGLKTSFMDPYGLYGNSIKIVPDLTGMSPSVHSAYGQSQWLENTQHVFQPPTLSDSDILDHIEYYGMSEESQTAVINQYMRTHSSLGQILPHFIH